MKGFRFKLVFEDSKPVVEQALVGCRRCRTTWREERTFYTSIRINGPMYDYDVCDMCLNDKDDIVR